MAAVATSRPRSAPHPVRSAGPSPCPCLRIHSISKTTAPANDPTNEPMMLPTTGMGSPATAPAMPPRIAPQPAARLPP
ncbi:MAG TPA: hypothetical protein VGV85_16655 [Longimicrobiaceae bacterium]|nr:hypothetical protein [Longimicrobiaceae bacterium]